MRVKVLGYSSADPNKVVARYRELEKINDDTYTYLYERCERNQDQDRLSIVLKIENIYFEADRCSRGYLQGHDLGKTGSEYVANFRTKIEEDMQAGRHVNLLNVRVFEALGWDSKPLLEYREQRAARLEAEWKQEQEQKTLAAEQAAREAAEKERQRLKMAKADFVAGKDIPSADFITLCRQAGVPIPLRTHGTLNARIISVNRDGTLRYYRIRGKRRPDATGCFKLIRTYVDVLAGYPMGTF